MLNKKDLKCLGEFIPSKYPKKELNYACVGRGGIFATDGAKAIMFHDKDMSFDDILVHKKLLKGFESLLGKDDLVKFVDVGGESFFSFDNTCLRLDTAGFEYVYPNSDDILNKVSIGGHFKLSSLSDILFELTSRFCFIDSAHLKPLLAHSGGDWYDVFYSPMGKDEVSMVNIVATVIRGEEEVVLYTALIMGADFKSKATNER